MPIDKDTRPEATQPPLGGIFLSEEQQASLKQLLQDYENTAVHASTTRAALEAVLPADRPDLHNQAASLAGRLVAIQQKPFREREAKFIEYRVPDKILQRRIKHALYADPREVLAGEREKWRQWLATSEEQQAVLDAAHILIEDEPPHPLLEFGVTFRERLLERAHSNGDVASTVKSRASQLGRLVLSNWPDFAGKIGEHYYVRNYHQWDGTAYLVRRTLSEKAVHFTDAGLANYQRNRLAGTADYATFLYDCLAGIVKVSETDANCLRWYGAPSIRTTMGDEAYEEVLRQVREAKARADAIAKARVAKQASITEVV